MAPWSTRLACMLMMAALVGTPAVISACAAICAVALKPAAAASGGQRQAHCRTPPPAMPGHDPLGSAAHEQESPTATLQRGAEATTALAVRMSTTGDGCCAGSASYRLTPLAPTRDDARPLSADVRAHDDLFRVTHASQTGKRPPPVGRAPRQALVILRL